MRNRFDRKLTEMRTNILKMGDMVYDELQTALTALETLDTDLASQVFEADNAVNQMRFLLEENCTLLIVTQQPAARDLRAIIAALSIVVDLERMGDKAKSIAKNVPHIVKFPSRPQPVELKQMAGMAGKMLRDCMTAYAQDDVDMARSVAARDDEVDRLYGQIFKQIIGHLAGAENPDRIEATYEVLRTARDLERFGDYTTNIAERVIYAVTGTLTEVNTD